jgi:hypothetical protein
VDAAVAPDTWSEFDPIDYLNEYYADIGAENFELLRFLADVSRRLPRGGVLLDFGGGPTIYTLISAASRVSEIHFADYLEENLQEVRRWLAEDSKAFDWDGFIRQALEMESDDPVTYEDVQHRAKMIRERVTHIAPCDASRTPPIDCRPELYDIVQTHFCAESATSDRWQWQIYVANIASLLKPGGLLVMSALEGATRYAVGSRWFPAVPISDRDLIEVLEENGFPQKRIELRCVPADRPGREYKGLLLTVAEKSTGREEDGS